MTQLGQLSTVTSDAAAQHGEWAVAAVPCERDGYQQFRLRACPLAMCLQITSCGV